VHVFRNVDKLHVGRLDASAVVWRGGMDASAALSELSVRCRSLEVVVSGKEGLWYVLHFYLGRRFERCSVSMLDFLVAFLNEGKPMSLCHCKPQIYK
jgi:hypothetical protein